MKKFNNTFKFLEYLTSLHGALHFKFCTTSYGKDFEWITDIEDFEDIETFDSLTRLEEVLFEFDDEYHETNELERGSARKYILKLNKEGLTCGVNYEWDYSDLGSKWEDKDLLELISNEITTILAKEIGITTIEFTDKYYYEITFSTDDTLEKGVFLLLEWGSDNTVEIPLSTWVSLRAAISKLSKNNGANTSESDCEFDYNLNEENNEIFERWSDEIDLEKLKNDKESYKVKL